jgi:hypothetical protein
VHKAVSQPLLFPGSGPMMMMVTTTGMGPKPKRVVTLRFLPLSLQFFALLLEGDFALVLNLRCHWV